MPTPVTSTYTSNTSVIGQINDAFSSAAGVTVAAASIAGALGAKSAVAGLSKVGAAVGITGAILESGAAIFGISGVNTKFNDKFMSSIKGAVSDYTPEQVAGKRFATPKVGELVYPGDLGNFFIQFTFTSYVKNGPLSPRQELPQVIITLPIPSNLQESFNMQYNSKSLGPLGRLANSDVVTADRLNKIISDTSGQAGEQATRDLAKGLAGAVKDPTLLNAVLRMGASGISDTLGAAAERVSGAVLNPYAALQFEGVSLRQHTFNFKFSPNNYDDSYRLSQIIKEFKIRMHPESKGLLYNFPDKCNIIFGDAVDMPYKLKPCFLESMSVNYAPTGTPSFFKQGIGPTDVELTLTFGEIEPITREFYSGEKISDILDTPSPPTAEASKPANAPKAGDIRDVTTGEGGI